MKGLSGNIRIAKTREDFYPTPTQYTRDILDREELVGSILEPACGNKGILRVVREYYPNAIIGGFDLYPPVKGVIKRDFLRYEKSWDNIITNPPYNSFLPFLTHALEVARKKVIFLFPLTYLSGKERFKKIYSISPPARIYVYSHRISLQSGPGGRNRIDFCWGVWDKGSTISELRWIYKEDNV